MSDFVKGMLTVLAAGAVLAVLAVLTDMSRNSACLDANYAKFAFDTCIRNTKTACLVSPGDVEKFSRAEVTLENLRCTVWKP